MSINDQSASSPAEAPVPTPTSTHGATLRDVKPYTMVHRWPWTTNEYVSTVLTAAVAAALTYLLHRHYDGNDATWTAAIIAAPLLVIAWLYTVKTSRVRRSQIGITITGTRIQVHQDGKVGSSAVDVAKARTIAYRKYGSDECFVISDGTQAARIPVRTLDDPRVRDLVDDAFALTDNIDGLSKHLYHTTIALHP